MVQRVCLVSGGTGGHLMPAMVLARAMQASGHEPVMVTEGRDVERELLRRQLPDVRGVELPAASRSRLALPLWVLRATAAARRILRDQQVDCVVSTGGRPSVPVALAAKSLGMPVYLLEQNAVTGRANRLLAPLAKRIYHGLPSDAAASPRALVTGTPLRPGIGRVDRAAARAELGFAAADRVVLVTGGSQGAQALNRTVPVALAAAGRSLVAAGAAPGSGGAMLRAVHLAGLDRDADVRTRYAASGSAVLADVRTVATDMDRLFAAADLVVCRGGGTTVAELCAVGRPAVIVPYPHHKDRQQLRNAEVLARAGAAWIVEESQLTAEGLAELLHSLFAEPERLRRMGDAARGLLPGDAAGAILRDMGLAGGGLAGSGLAGSGLPGSGLAAAAGVGGGSADVRSGGRA
ncbi:MAG: UDP-N-acetylglucosamine--N-acetylmuramyl-(pentapeptide) pyrophosphoryl-undecaprenol N-acetylglucosamine transferase [Planctomycetota bacterium]|jgi:UDP-N-acetylglucosamine--N-acetylmuramyl-(pentapeptide) pyrophosphoryl-undecaprenol N-acetylglucosamine transferase